MFDISVKLFTIYNENQKLSKFASARSNAGKHYNNPARKKYITPYHRQSNMQVTFNATIIATSGSMAYDN